MSTPLFDADHPYYGPDSCYYANGQQQAEWNHVYESWEDFKENGGLLYGAGTDEGSGFTDLNWVYRWDWNTPDPDDYKYELEEDPSFEVPGEELWLYYIFPRKGMIAMNTIKVTREDEPAVRAWLQKFADYMVTMWAPLDLSPKVVTDASAG